MIPVRITKPIYIRKGSGVSHGEIGVAPASGKVIMMDGVKIDGDVWKGINKWYYKINNKGERQWYWGGRVEEFDHAKVVVNYNRLIQKIPDEWRNAFGDKVKVAILDAGFDVNHVDISGSIHQTYNVTDKSNNVSPDTEIIDHGSNVAGLITSYSNNIDGIIGIAPAAKLILIKVSTNGHIAADHVLEGLEYAINIANVDIINLSLSVDETEYNLLRNDFLNLLDRAKEKNILIIASGGENSGLLNKHSNILFPANEDYCLSIGTVNSKFLQNNPTPRFNSRLDYLIPYTQLKSCSGQKNDYSFLDNSSMAAAVLTGVSTLLRSFLGIRIERKDFIDKLQITTSPYSSISSTSLSIYKP